jgi:SAM-dependent methyltransferase
MLREGLAPGGRTLDVACGTAHLAAGITARGGQGWGIEPSQEMLGISRWVYPAESATLVRGVAETLPFRDASFDKVICQGSLDHFVAPRDFMREAARIVRPDGRVIVGLANYESLSCRLGRLLRGHLKEEWPYYSPPHDHYHKGEMTFVQKLGAPWLTLERCYGLSLLWLLRGPDDWRWGKWLDGIPRGLAQGMLTVLDRVAFHTPALADTIVSVWKPR